MIESDNPRDHLAPEDYDRVDRATRRLLDKALDECTREDLYSLTLMQRAELKVLREETARLVARNDQLDARIRDTAARGAAAAEAFANGEVDR